MNPIGSIKPPPVLSYTKQRVRNLAFISKSQFIQLFPTTNNVSNPFEGFLENLLNFKRERELAWAQYLNKIEPNQDSGLNYQEYFQFPNETVFSYLETILGSDYSQMSDDEKAYKIEQYIRENLTYISDLANYAMVEYWAKPTETISSMKEDCDGGAWLIGSLLLHAGIDPDRVRFFGGSVKTGASQLGGHAWVGYKMENGEWVALDWCYLPTDKPLAERVPLKYNLNYFDDYFYTTLYKTVVTDNFNTLRDGLGAKGSQRSYSSNFAPVGSIFHVTT